MEGRICGFQGSVVDGVICRILVRLRWGRSVDFRCVYEGGDFLISDVCGNGDLWISGFCVERGYLWISAVRVEVKIFRFKVCVEGMFVDFMCICLEGEICGFRLCVCEGGGDLCISGVCVERRIFGFQVFVCV